MKADALLRFRILFEQQKRSLLYSQGILNEDFVVSPEDFLDEVDMSSSELETSMRIRLRNREALFLKKIEESLIKIQMGTFGECESCKEQIDLKRLEARPTTTMCIGCKEEAERKEAVHVDGRKPKSLGKGIRFA